MQMAQLPPPRSPKSAISYATWRAVFAPAAASQQWEAKMSWYSDVGPPKIRSFLRRDTPENLWVKCPESGELVFHKDLETSLYVVPGSGHHMRMPAKARLDNLFDEAAYEELPT